MLTKEEFYNQLSLLKKEELEADDLWVLVDRLENRYMAGYLHSSFSEHEEELLDFLLYETPTFGEWNKR